MFLQPGIISGRASLPSTPTYEWVQLQSVLLRSSGGTSIYRLTDRANSITEDSAPLLTRSFPFNDSDGVMISASTNVYTSILASEYVIPTLTYVGWNNVTEVPLEYARLGMGWKNTLLSGEQRALFFQDNNNQKDAINWIASYTTNLGTCDFVESQYTTPTISNTVTCPLGAGAQANDWVIISLQHQVPFDIPTGATLEFRDKIQGKKLDIPNNQRNHTLSVFKKQITSDDIVAGAIVFTAYGA